MMKLVNEYFNKQKFGEEGKEKKRLMNISMKSDSTHSVMFGLQSPDIPLHFFEWKLSAKNF